MNTLDVYCEGNILYTDGQDDTSGEVFPPYRAGLYYCKDGRFRWTVWPSIIEFTPLPEGVAVSVTTPGGALYRGTKTGPAIAD